MKALKTEGQRGPSIAARPVAAAAEGSTTWDTGYRNDRLEGSYGWVVKVRSVFTGRYTGSTWVIPGDDGARGWLANQFTNTVRKATVGPVPPYSGWALLRPIAGAHGGWLVAASSHENYRLNGIPYDVLFNSMMAVMRVARSQSATVNHVEWSLYDTQDRLIYSFSVMPTSTWQA